MELRKSVQQLDPRLRAIYDDERRLVDAFGVASHRGWPVPTRGRKAIDIRSRAVSKPPVCAARMVQWAVGQGGFWTTSGTYWAQHFERTFEIVFDCGFIDRRRTRARSA